MKKFSIIILLVILVAAGTLFTLYDNRFPYGRMWETPAIRPHEEKIPQMEKGVVPFAGGEAIYRQMPGEKIQSSIAHIDASVIAAGQTLYANYCVQCHGKYHDGNGTVGQSFAPLPGNLRSAKVQGMAEGVLFKEISYGKPGGRQPALATTIAMADRWKIIAYVKSLGVRSGQE
jgi:mono/diheme cytochrome c family protein